MKSYLLCFCLCCSCLQLKGEEYKPVLFESTRLVYEDDFSSGSLNTQFWQIRQSSTWSVQDGVLIGGPSSKEFQAKKIAAGDKAHAGLKPVIWLEKVPENLVVHFRVRFDAEDYHPKFPLIDVGHHIHSVTFGKGTTKLTIKKDQKTFLLDNEYLPLNTWVDVTIELKPGAMLLQVNDKQTIWNDQLITMVDQQQIDFKGVDYGKIHIDDVKVYEGIDGI